MRVSGSVGASVACTDASVSDNEPIRVFCVIIRKLHKMNRAGRKFLRPARFSVFVKDASAKIAIFKFGYSFSF